MRAGSGLAGSGGCGHPQLPCPAWGTLLGAWPLHVCHRPGLRGAAAAPGSSRILQTLLRPAGPQPAAFLPSTRLTSAPLGWGQSRPGDHLGDAPSLTLCFQLGGSPFPALSRAAPGWAGAPGHPSSLRGMGSSAPGCSRVGGGPLGATQGGGSSGALLATGPSPPLGFHADAAGMICPVSEGRPDLRAGRAPRAGPPLASIPPAPAGSAPRGAQGPPAPWTLLAGRTRPPDGAPSWGPPLLRPSSPDLFPRDPLPRSQHPHPAPTLPRGSLSSRSISGLVHTGAAPGPPRPVRVLCAPWSSITPLSGPVGCNLQYP